MRAVFALKTIVQVHTGNGNTRVKIGEKLQHAAEHSTREWYGGMWFDVEGLSSKDHQRPAHPPDLALEKEWAFLGGDDGSVVETRAASLRSFGRDYVVVFREGVALPTDALLDIVHNAHAVLVLRGTDEYFYLHNRFVLSTEEEEALVEWGIGRPLFANSCLAVGGTLLVAFAEKIWGPAVVGTLLVAASGYRVQGALTKVLRVRSVAWTTHKLVPSGIHGIERVVQLVLVTLVALADLLDDRVLLLTALTLAAAQVVVMEYVGQACLTWGYVKYHRILCAQLGVWTGVCAGLAAWLWLSYVFAVYLGCMVFGSMLLGVLLYVGLSFSFDEDREWTFFGALLSIVAFGITGVMIWASVLGWDEADLKYSPKSLLPWRWPLIRSPDSFSSVFRVVGLWLGAGVGCFIVVYIVVGVLSFRISSDASVEPGPDKRTRERKKKGVFSHYHESSIPSRNLLEPGVGEQGRDVAQQTQTAPIASVV